MSWMKKYLKDITIQKSFIFTKCNSPPSGYTPPNSEVTRLPNIGRCDHTYARWMNQLEEKDAIDDHIVLFFVGGRDASVPMDFRSIKVCFDKRIKVTLIGYSTINFKIKWIRI